MDIARIQNEIVVVEYLTNLIKKKTDDEAAAMKKKASDEAAAAKKNKTDDEVGAKKKKINEEAVAAKKKTDDEAAAKKADEASAENRMVSPLHCSYFTSDALFVLFICINCLRNAFH